MTGEKDYSINHVGSRFDHKKLKHIHFERWWTDELQPNFPDKPVAVINKYKYHPRQATESKSPTTAWKETKFNNGSTKKN